jgi:hypothetical protein
MVPKLRRSVARRFDFIEADQRSGLTGKSLALSPVSSKWCATGLRQINPAGKSVLVFGNRVKPRKQKYSASHFGKSEVKACHLIPEEGRWPSSPSVGMGCGGRFCFSTRERETNEQGRTAKSCGPDAAMLASSRQQVCCR